MSATTKKELNAEQVKLLVAVISRANLNITLSNDGWEAVTLELGATNVKATKERLRSLLAKLKPKEEETGNAIEEPATPTAKGKAKAAATPRKKKADGGTPKVVVNGKGKAKTPAKRKSLSSATVNEAISDSEIHENGEERNYRPPPTSNKKSKIENTDGNGDEDGKEVKKAADEAKEIKEKSDVVEDENENPTDADELAEDLDVV